MEMRNDVTRLLLSRMAFHFLTVPDLSIILLLLLSQVFGRATLNDTRFSSAVHLLILVSEAESPMSSAQIAESIGTNPSWVRRLATSLREAGIITSHPGQAGFHLAVSVDEISLLDVYRASCGHEGVRVFDTHRNPNDACIVGRHIRPVVGALFADVDEAATRALRERTLADCIALMREDVKRTGDKDAREGGAK
jgi:Rrf2 family protein